MHSAPSQQVLVPRGQRPDAHTPRHAPHHAQTATATASVGHSHLVNCVVLVQGQVILAHRHIEHRRHSSQVGLVHHWGAQPNCQFQMRQMPLLRCRSRRKRREREREKSEKKERREKRGKSGKIEIEIVHVLVQVLVLLLVLLFVVVVVVVVVFVLVIERKCLEQQSRARKWVLAGARDREKYEQLCTLKMYAATAHESLIACRN